MIMFTLSFQAWRRFTARRMPKVTTSWLRQIRDESRKAFRRGMTKGPHTGRIYSRRGGRRHQASASGEYPAKNSGRLLASLKAQSSPTEAIIGTNAPYSRYLREGTKHMARRKMSDNALQEGRSAVGSPRGWVAWYRRKGR